MYAGMLAFGCLLGLTLGDLSKIHPVVLLFGDALQVPEFVSSISGVYCNFHLLIDHVSLV